MKRAIKKVLEELNKESPRLDYIRGMLEVLVDEEEYKYVYKSPLNSSPITAQPVEIKDEASILDAKAAASLVTIKELAEKSIEQN